MHACNYLGRKEERERKEEEELNKATNSIKNIK